MRVVVGGAEQVRWVDLAAVRLPAAARRPGWASRGRGAGGSAGRDGGDGAVSELRGLLAAGLPGRSAGRRRRHASDLTAELPVVRCAEAGEASGRHRAPAAGSGRHRAGADVRPAPGRTR